MSGREYYENLMDPSQPYVLQEVSSNMQQSQHLLQQQQNQMNQLQQTRNHGNSMIGVNKSNMRQNVQNIGSSMSMNNREQLNIGCKKPKCSKNKMDDDKEWYNDVDLQKVVCRAMGIKFYKTNNSCEDGDMEEIHFHPHLKPKYKDLKRYYKGESNCVARVPNCRIQRAKIKRYCKNKRGFYTLNA